MLDVCTFYAPRVDQQQQDVLPQLLAG